MSGAGSHSSRPGNWRAAPRAWLAALARHQHGAWFGPADPRALAVGRILIFWHVWPGFRLENYAVYADLKASAWYPVSFFRAWSVPLLDASGLQLLSGVATVASLCALLGFFYPIAAPVSALVTLYLRGVPQNFGKVNHSENLLIFGLLVFACARAADAWSVDAWLGRRLGKGPKANLPSGHYRWPMRFIALLILTMYGAAGASKLMNSGWDWALSDSFRNLLLRHHFTHKPPTQLGVWVAELPRLCQALALGALLTELSAPLALFSRWLYRALVPGLFMLQLSIWVFLGVSFRPMLPLFLCLLPWESALRALDGTRLWIARQVSARGRRAGE